MKTFPSFLLRVLFALYVGLVGFRLYAEDSAYFYWDNRDVKVVSGTMRMSSTSTGEDTGTLQVDGAAASGWSADEPSFDSTQVDDGVRTLTLSGTAATAGALVLNDGVVIHEDVLEADEVWASDKIHIVRNWVRIPKGKKLIITNGTVVKFCQGTGILNNGTLSAMSATLTALEDDTVAGDTNLNGDASAPAADTYAFTNNGTLTAINCTMNYATEESVFKTTTIPEGAFSGCEELTKVVIPDDVTTVGANAFKDCTNLNEVTFEGTTTTVGDTAFDGCGELERVVFTHGFPENNYVFGEASPTVYVNENYLPDTWNGYTVADGYSENILGQTLLVPEEEGEAGQVLTVTEDGYEWQDIPVDAALDAESTNAVQNMVVAAAIGALEDADDALADDITALQTKDDELVAVDTALAAEIDALQEDAQSLKNADAAVGKEITSLKAKDDELAAADTAIQGDITTLQGNVTALQGADSLIQADITALQAKDTSLAEADAAMQGDISDLQAKDTELASADTAMASDIASLQETVDGLTGVPSESGEAGQVLTKTEEGIEWQAINVIVDEELDAESENSVQNKVVTAALNGLSKTDEELAAADDTMADEVTALQTKDTELAAADADMADEITALKTKDKELVAADAVMAGEITALQTADSNLSTLVDAQQTTITALQTTDALLYSSVKTLQSDVSALQGADALIQSDVKALQETDAGLRTDVGALQGDVTALQTAEGNLSTRIDAQQTAITALQTTDASLNSSVAELQSKDAELVKADADIQKDVKAVKSDVSGLKTENDTQQASIEALQKTVASQQATIDELTTKLSTLLAVLDGGEAWQVLTKTEDGGYTWMDSDAMGQEIMTINLEAGWNLVAMPGRVVVDASEESMVDQIEIYTYDKKQKVYVKSDGLKPLTSYWMCAPKKCTIHFVVADEKPEEEEEK